MIAPPGYPKMVSTFSATSERSRISDPEIFFTVCFSPCAFGSFFVSNAPICSGFYLFSILEQNSFFRVQRRRLPCSPALCERLLIDYQIYLMAENIDLY